MRLWDDAIAELPHLRDLPQTSKLVEELRLAELAGKRHLHCDHVIPIVEDESGLRDLGNMQTLCSVCHSKKTFRENHRMQ